MRQKNPYKPLYRLADSETWRIEFYDHRGRRQRWALNTKSLKLAQELAKQIDSVLACRVSGDQPDSQLSRWLESCPVWLLQRMADADMLANSRVAGCKPLSEHIDDFKAYVEAKGATSRQAAQQAGNVERLLIDQLKLTFWRGVDGDAVLQTIATLKSKDDKSLSVESKNKYIQAVKMFSRWMKNSKRSAGDLLDHIQPLPKRGIDDSKRARRPFTQDELSYLLKWVRDSGKERYSSTGEARALLYETAVYTGLRVNELRSLTIADIDIQRQEVSLSGRHTKNGKPAILPLRQELADKMAGFIRGKMPGASLFYVPDKPTKMLDKDIDDARSSWLAESQTAAVRAERLKSDFLKKETEQGILCFHGFRHTFATLLGDNGIHPKTAMSLLRHSDVNLTMAIYSHSIREREASAVAALPDFDRPASEAVKKTGTDDVSPNIHLVKSLPNQCTELDKKTQIGEFQTIFGTVDKCTTNPVNDCNIMNYDQIKRQPADGLEPSTVRLQSGGSTN